MDMYNFKIRHVSWQKRRPADAVPTPESATVHDFKLLEEHSCRVSVAYSDGVTRELTGRVLKNSIKGTWAVNAFANGGWTVILDVEPGC